MSCNAENDFELPTANCACPADGAQEGADDLKGNHGEVTSRESSVCLISSLFTLRPHLILVIAVESYFCEYERARANQRRV